ncbi:MAG: hypothetical protein ACKOU7_02755 [Ferruginibacter sp.]
MNPTHLHLLLNHFPIIGTLIGSCLLLWGIITKNGHIKSISALLLACMAVIAIPVYLTGEPAEESVEQLGAVNEQAIQLHEEAAEIAIWLMGITGIISLVALLLSFKKYRQGNLVFVLAFILSALCFASMARTGYLGGQIRHTEISSTVGSNAGQAEQETEGNAQAADKVKERKESKDDD